MNLQLAFKILIWLLGGGFLLASCFPRRKMRVLGKTRERWSLSAALILLIPLTYWCAMRSTAYGDTEFYRTSFNQAPSSVWEIPAYMNAQPKDAGFYGFSALLKCLFGGNFRVYFFLLAAIQIVCVAMVYRKYSRNYWLSIFLFVASTDYTSWMYNGTRQFMAVVIIFAALPLLLKKRYLWTAVLILFASVFHQSALLMLPVIFLVQGKAWNKKTNLVLLGVLLAVLFVGEFTNFLDTLMEDTQYENVVSDWQTSGDDGTNLLRVLVYAVPTILAFVYRRVLQESRNPLINLCVNMSIISTGIYILSMFTSGIFIGRLPIYMSLYLYILLPWEIRHFFPRKWQFPITTAACTLYTLFYFYSYL